MGNVCFRNILQCMAAFKYRMYKNSFRFESITLFLGFDALSVFLVERSSYCELAYRNAETQNYEMFTYTKDRSNAETYMTHCMYLYISKCCRNNNLCKIFLIFEMKACFLRFFEKFL